MKLMRIIFITAFILFHSLANLAQKAKAINVGEACPNITINGIINYPKSSVKISDFQGKLLILDFWATWCRPCVAAFPKIDSLQKKFGNSLQILPVTSEDGSTISAFLGKMNNIKKILTPTVTNDQELRRLFPHIIVPHCVWINKDGKVVAITDGLSVTEANIHKLLEGKEANLSLKKDEENIIAESRDGVPSLLPAYKVLNGDNIDITSMDSSRLLVQSVLTRYISGFTSGTSNRDSTLLSVWNESVLQLYRVALWKHGIEILNNAKTIADIQDTVLLKKITGSVNTVRLISREDWPAWMQENNYCYEIKVPPAQSRDRFDIMLEELNRYFGRRFGIEGAMEKRKTKYLSLVRTVPEDKLATKGGNPFAESDGSYSIRMQNANLDWLLNKLRFPLKLYPWMENETGYNSMVDLDLNCQLSDLNALNKELAKYGLQFVEKEKMMDIAVVRMKK